MTVVICLALTLVLLAAAAVVFTEQPEQQAVTLSAFGLSLTVLFLTLQAPDVALSQLAVGAAVVPLLVMLTVNKIRGRAMSRAVRLWLMGLGLAAVGTCLALAFVRLPAFGGTTHPYRDGAVQATVAHSTANAVASVTYDQRGLDTFGEESILLGSVIGVAALLRPSKDEEEAGPSPTGRVLPSTLLLGYVMLPTTLIIGLVVVAHGHLTPGGGFQGGVILATGLHLLYVAGSYPALQRMRPVGLFEDGEAVGAAAFGVLGIVGILMSAVFLANVLPFGQFGQLLSAGTVPLLNGAVGLEVASSVIVLLAKFLSQAILLGKSRS